MAIEQVHKWQSRGAYLAVNRHISGSCVAVVQAYKRHMILYDIQKAYIPGSQQTHTWQAKGSYMAVIRGSCSCIQKVQSWQ